MINNYCLKRNSLYVLVLRDVFLFLSFRILDVVVLLNVIYTVRSTCFRIYFSFVYTRVKYCLRICWNFYSQNIASPIDSGIFLLPKPVLYFCNRLLFKWLYDMFSLKKRFDVYHWLSLHLNLKRINFLPSNLKNHIRKMLRYIREKGRTILYR